MKYLVGILKVLLTPLVVLCFFVGLNIAFIMEVIMYSSLDTDFVHKYLTFCYNILDNWLKNKE